MRQALLLNGAALSALGAVAAAGWTRETSRPRTAIAITDVRPLRVSEPSLHRTASHYFAVRVAVDGWTLLPYEPGTVAAPRDGGHWRLYLDGHRLGESYGTAGLAYTPYLTPGTHWIAAELTNIDSTSLTPPVWSEPVVLHVPRRIRCWQTGWHGTPDTGTPRYNC